MEIGSRIGPYEIRQRIGEGGMAQVWKAWHLTLHRFEALKIPTPHPASTSGVGADKGAGVGADKGVGPSAWPGGEQAFVARFLYEARIAAGLRHPHIATIYGVSEADAPEPFFAMELVEGGDLSVLLRAHGRMSLEHALPILEAIAEALDYAHGLGVIHRDIKPANVLLEATPRGWSPKVVDFGIAHARHAPAPAELDAELDAEAPGHLDEEGNIVGTPEYMSPEQAGSGEEVGPRSDIYSLGAVAYEMLCGRPPFVALRGLGPASIVAQHLSEPPPRPSSWHPDLPHALDDALAWALAKSPGERPASAAEFVESLRHAQGPGSASEAPPSAWRPGLAMPAAPTVPTAPAEALPNLPPVSEPVLEPTLEFAAGTDAGPTSPTLVQAREQPVPSPDALSDDRTRNAKALRRKDAAPRWLAPASAAGVLCLGAALLGAQMSRTRPEDLPASTSEPAARPPSASEPGVAEEMASQAPAEVPTPLPTAGPTEAPGKAVAPGVESAEDEERRARAESTAQKARREKLNVIDSLLLLRKRQERDLLRPSEAAASRRKLMARLRGALSLCEAALQLDEGNETAWEQKAALLFLMGRFEEALAVAKQGLQKFPGNHDLQDARDKASARLGHPLQGRA